MFIKWMMRQIAPDVCLQCGSEGAILCTPCIPKSIGRRASTCFRCNRLTPDFRTCQRCRRHTPLYRVVVAGQYEAITKELIYRLKYYHVADAAIPLALMMSSSLESVDEYDLLLPVPASTKRFRQRGYNQAQLLAKELSDITGIPVKTPLQRYGHKEQIGAERKERLNQLKGQIELSKNVNLEDQRILLVDDVVTTGATLHECAKVLKQAGAKRIDAVVAAKN